MRQGLAALLALALTIALALLPALTTLTLARPAGAQDLSGIARVTGPLSLSAEGDGLELGLTLTQPVPFRARLLHDPLRVVVDFRRVDWAGLSTVHLALPAPLTAMRLGEAGAGWTRMVLELSRPMRIEGLLMQTDPSGGAARFGLRLSAASQAAFDDQARLLAGSDADRSPAPGVAPGLASGVAAGSRPLVVVIDPGHGGIDPGAERDGLRESDLTLGFARELAEVLRRSGMFEAVLTRDSDDFVSLEGRIRAARQAGADLFVSIHADALAEGVASGATIYTMAEEASEAAAAALAERHDRADLLGGGVDLSASDDEVAGVLMAIAQTETRPRTEALAGALVAAIGEAGLRLHSRPWQQAAFSVLKAPDIPSVLLELGFLSSARDRANLTDPAWRARMAAAILAGLDAWAADEAVRRALLRR